jgi:glycosyltransferase involved in cell wall biosynthesis
MNGESIAVCLPCYNEALTISKTVTDFRAALPEAVIYVFDNASTDNSADLAKAAGAVVIPVHQRGKGNVVRAIFREIDADVYVMADADDTYPADEVKKIIRPIMEDGFDMVTGDRLSTSYYTENKRPGHNFGNALVCWLVSFLWKSKVKDVMTGYRAFSRCFVKNCPVFSEGFEIETEITLHAFDKRLRILEVPISYRDRPSGSVSKLRTVHDGLRVLSTIFNTFRLYRPLQFFGIIGLSLMLLGVLFSTPVFIEFFKTGMVPRFPTLIFSTFLGLAGLVSCASALILDAMKKQADREYEVSLVNYYERNHLYRSQKKPVQE